ncbi:hypothetical protein CEXT_79861, partial [Caerostris extrusa]
MLWVHCFIPESRQIPELQFSSRKLPALEDRVAVIGNDANLVLFPAKKRQKISGLMNLNCLWII